MERLTKRDEQNTNYYYPLCFKKCYGLGASRKCDSCTLTRKVCEKLGKYEDAEEQGLLLRLPCKVGDTVYHVVSNRICEVENVDLFFLLLSVAENKFEKTVFLTKEEAEQALADMKEGSNNE